MFSDFDIFYTSLVSSTDGQAYTNSSLSNPLTGNGTNCRGWNFTAGLAGVGRAFGLRIKNTIQDGAFVGVPITKKITVKAWLRLDVFDQNIYSAVACKMSDDPTDQFGTTNYSFGLASYSVGFTNYPRLRLSTSGIDYDFFTPDPGIVQSATDGNGDAIVADKWYRLKLEVFNVSPNVDRLIGYHLTGPDEDNPSDWTQIATLDTTITNYLPWGDPSLSIGFFGSGQGYVDGLVLLNAPKYDGFSVRVSTLGGESNPVALDASSGTKLFIPSSDVVSAPSINTDLVVQNVVSSTQFEVEMSPNEYGSYVDGVVVPQQAPVNTHTGPYVLDPDAGLSVTGVGSETAQVLSDGQRYASINVADATVFPDEEGFLVFGFGYEHQVGPVRYIGRYSDTELALDYNFQFNKDVPIGSSLTLLSQKGAFDPSGALPGAFYLTASNSGQIEAVKTLNEIIAEGVKSEIKIVYPGDRGLGNEGYPTEGPKVTDAVRIWGPDDLDAISESED